MLVAENLTKRFGKFTAIEKLSCHVGRSSIYGLVGYNGAGKTTLLKCMSGIYRPEEGDVFIDDQPVYENEALKRRIFFVPDDLYFLPQASMNRMARFYKGYYPSFNMEIFEKLAKVFELNPARRIRDFSKGMQRQAALLLGISTLPDYLLLDESFDGLDPVKRSMVKEMLMQIMSERELSIVVSSHNLQEVEGLCDHIGIINGKRIAYDCSIKELCAEKSKCRVMFRDPADEKVLQKLGAKRIERDGNLITFMAPCSEERLRSEMEGYQPVVLEIVPMTLEEVFLTEAEVENHDFKAIFG